VLAKWVATADHLSGGRVAVNVVSGWFKDEFRQLGEPWLEHDERYRRSAEFIQALKLIWTEAEANLAGDFYRIRDFSLKPKPLSGHVGRFELRGPGSIRRRLPHTADRDP
jgi:FMNH2-dependent dimethyl sulfone monooxygenase